MTIEPLTREKRIDTDESYEIHLCDLDADYVIDEKEVWSALMGAIHESVSALDISKIKDTKELLKKRYVPISILEKSFPIFFDDKLKNHNKENQI